MKVLYYIRENELGAIAIKIELDENAKKPIKGTVYNQHSPEGFGFDDVIDIMLGDDLSYDNVTKEEFETFLIEKINSKGEK
ncbi:MAG: hypothetical protein EOM59_00220 [Clostridia bacterium]|nr:hypothetical protein [Clostridia bacterium]